jgi:carbonic anhydrase
MAKRGLDQVTAWMIAAFGAVSIYGAGYGIYKVAVKSAMRKMEEKAAGLVAARSAETKDHHSSAETESPATVQHAETKPADETTAEGKPAPIRSVPWSYSGSAGPEKWAALDPAWRVCGTGKQQSPVDISATYTDRKSLPVNFQYHPSRISLQHTGRTIQGEFNTLANHIMFEGERFDLIQVQLHAPAEHRLQDATLPFELHLVHRTETGKTAIVAVLFQIGESNKALAELFRLMPDSPGHFSADAVTFNPVTAIPKKRAYYTYQGSLTAPPCTEGVTWIVMQQLLEISVAQQKKFVEVVGKNARPIQGIGSRRIRLSPR